MAGVAQARVRVNKVLQCGGAPWVFQNVLTQGAGPSMRLEKPPERFCKLSGVQFARVGIR